MRSIPACAGEPDVAAVGVLSVEVYPRVCGGTEVFTQLLDFVLGLSPRVRGNHRGWTDFVEANRSIPACAGEPPASTRSRCR